MSLKKTFASYNKRDLLITKILASLITLSVFVITIGYSINSYKLTNRSNEYTETLIGEYQGITPFFPKNDKINDQISYLIYEGLTKYNPKTQTIEPNLATFTTNPDSTKFIFNLKTNLEWSDGEPITIDDVLFTYKNIFQHPQFPNEYIKTTFQSIEINQISTNEIEFILPNSNSFFLSQTTLPILPKHIHKGIDIDQIKPDNFPTEELIGNGPYKFEKVEQLKKGITRVLLRKNKNYHKQNPNIKTVEFLIYPTEELAFHDQTNTNSFPNLNYIQQSSIDQTKFQFQKYTLPQYTSLFINNSDTLLSKLYIRQAISNSIDLSEIQDKFPDKKIINSPIFYLEESQATTPNYNQVRQNLEDLGFTINGEGIYERENQSLKFTLHYPLSESDPIKQEETQKLVNLIKNNLQKSGILVEPTPIPSQLVNPTILSKNYQLLLFGQDIGKDLDLYPFWHSSQSGEGKLNLSNYQNSINDQLINTLRKEINNDKQKEYIKQLHENFQQNAPAVFLYSDYHTFTFDNKVKNRNILMHYSSTSDRFYDIYLWTVD